MSWDGPLPFLARDQHTRLHLSQAGPLVSLQQLSSTPPHEVIAQKMHAPVPEHAMQPTQPAAERMQETTLEE